ncbi:hypothetical protein JT163_00155, partial [Helicobacter pylori]|nr:hypothetical protein [Helicobacter pylori]
KKKKKKKNKTQTKKKNYNIKKLKPVFKTINPYDFTKKKVSVILMGFLKLAIIKASKSHN